MEVITVIFPEYQYNFVWLQNWQAFFEQRWRPVLPGSGLDAAQEKESTWQACYGRKMHAQRVFGGRARQDTLFGHRGGVRCLALLPSCNLLATGTLNLLKHVGQESKLHVILHAH